MIGSAGYPHFEYSRGRQPGGWSNFGRLVLGCIEADILRVNLRCAVVFKLCNVCALLHTSSFGFSGWFFQAFPLGIPTSASLKTQTNPVKQVVRVISGNALLISNASLPPSFMSQLSKNVQVTFKTRMRVTLAGLI